MLNQSKQKKSNNRIIWTMLAALATFGLLFLPFALCGQDSKMERALLEVEGQTVHTGEDDYLLKVNLNEDMKIWYAKSIDNDEHTIVKVEGDEAYTLDKQSCFTKGIEECCDITIWDDVAKKAITFTLMDPLGIGGNATVWRAEDITTGVKVAVKFAESVHFTAEDEGKMTKKMWEEDPDHSVEYIGSINNPYFGVTEAKSAQTYKAIILGLCDNSANRYDLEKEEIKQMMISVIKASQKLRDIDTGYLHRDIKINNIFWKKGKGWILGDYGAAISIPEAKQLLQAKRPEDVLETYSYPGTNRSQLDLYILNKWMVGRRLPESIMETALEMDAVFDITNVAISALNDKTDFWKELDEYFLHFIRYPEERKEQEKYKKLVEHLRKKIIGQDVAKFKTGSTGQISLEELIIYVLGASVDQVEGKTFDNIKLDAFLKLVERVNVTLPIQGVDMEWKVPDYWQCRKEQAM